MANKLKITHNDGATDAAVSPIQVGGAYIGGTGGLTSQTGQQIQPQVYITGGSSTSGSIVRQKGAHKFLCTDGTRTGTLTLVNSPNLSAGQMNVLINLSTATANVAAANVAGGATSTYVTWTATPTGPVTTPRVGDYIIGFAGAAAVAQVTAINTASNVTVAVTGNVAAQTGVSITDSTYATRITNRSVTDFNGAKFFYRLAAPTATYVQVQSA
jgi:hypothetical protein